MNRGRARSTALREIRLTLRQQRDKDRSGLAGIGAAEGGGGISKPGRDTIVRERGEGWRRLEMAMERESLGMADNVRG